MSPVDLMLWSVAGLVVVACLSFSVLIIWGAVNGLRKGRQQQKRGFRQMRD